MKGRRLLALGLGMSCLMWAVAAVVRPNPGLRRYVSQPLPDGSRVTFLYPGELRLTGDSPRQRILARRATPIGGLKRMVCEFDQGAFSADAEYVTVFHGPVTAKVRSGRLSRRHVWQCGNGGPPRGWDVHLVEPRSRRTFSLYYRLRREEPLSFEARKHIISQSFQVLTKGQEPPRDHAVVQGGKIVEGRI